MARDVDLIGRLQGICGKEHVLTHPHALATYRSDGLKHYQQTPVAAVLPGTGEQVQAVVRACFEAGVPWVARGAGTGLSGGALPVAEGVLIVLARLRRILAVELEDSRVVVEPGVSNLAISRAVAPTHFYPPDPSSQIVCSIGGNVAENSGGAHCFKYGFTTNYVTGLEIVLTDGSVVELDRDAPGLRPARSVRGLRGDARRRHADRAAGRARRPRRCARWWRSSRTPARPETQ